MLVLSRGEKDRIVFPTLGISIEVTKIKGSRASLGIDAPKDIRVVRHELLDGTETFEMKGASSGAAGEEARRRQHELRNQINVATLKLQMAAKLLTRGEVEQGLSYMMSGIAELSAISAGAADTKPAQEMSLAEAQASFNVGAPKTGRRVLLVDDDANERSLMASYLQRCGLTVDEASDGLKALYALSKAEQPDVVLLDMNMPNLGGRETIERIRRCSSNPTVPVFAVTADPMEETGVTIGSEGVTGWFQKPVQVDQIVDAIDRCLATAK